MSTVRSNVSALNRFLVAGLLVGLALAPAQPRTPTTSDEEIAKATTACREHPGDASWSRLGDAFMQKGRETADTAYYGRAEAAYRRALQANPKYADALAGMAWVTGGRHEFEKSIEWANQALAVGPNRADAYGLLGDAAVEMGDYDEAIENYEKMLAIRPNISSYSRGAHLLYLTGDLKRGSLLMVKAMAAGGPYPENVAWCRAQLALMHFAQGAYLPALQVLTEGLRDSPANYQLFLAMGKVKTALKDYPAAIEYYKKSKAIVPQHDVVVALGDLYTLEGKTSEASEEYALVETIHKINQANGVIGDMQMAQFFAEHDRNLPEALRLAETEYKTRKNVYAADTLAWCYYKNGRVAEAKKYIDKALSRKTPEASFLFHKGVIYAKAGEIAVARTALYQALSLNPNFHPLAAPLAAKMIMDLGSSAPAE